MGTEAISQTRDAVFTTRCRHAIRFSCRTPMRFSLHTHVSLSISAFCNMLCRLISPMNNKWWIVIGNSRMIPCATDLMDASVLQDPLHPFFHPVPLFCSIHPQLEISISRSVIDWMNHPEQHPPNLIPQGFALYRVRSNSSRSKMSSVFFWFWKCWELETNRANHLLWCFESYDILTFVFTLLSLCISVLQPDMGKKSKYKTSVKKKTLNPEFNEVSKPHLLHLMIFYEFIILWFCQKHHDIVWHHCCSCHTIWALK